MRVSNDLLILFINYDGSCFLTAPTKAQISDWAVLRYIHIIYIYIYIYMKWKSLSTKCSNARAKNLAQFNKY